MAAVRALATTLVAPLVAAAITAAPATAQDAAQDARNLSAIYAAEVFQQEVIAMGKPGLDNGGDDGAAAAAGPDTAVQQALTYQTSPEVARRTPQEPSASIVVPTADTATKPKVQHTSTSCALRTQFPQITTTARTPTTQ